MNKYRIVYGDPAWQYRVWSKKGQGRSAENHYPTMSIEDICAIPVGDIADTDCALFLWATFPNLENSFAVIRAWGFTYKTVAFVWCKRNRKSDGWFTGLGHWTRANVEICLLATRGNPRRRIVELMGDIPRIELFARQRYPGWDAWGNEVDSDIELTPFRYGTEPDRG